MTRLLSKTNLGLLTSLSLVLASGACSSSDKTPNPGGTAGASSSVAGASNGTAGASSPGAAGTPAGTAGNSNPGTAGSGNVAGAPPGTAGSAPTAGAPPVGTAGTTGAAGGTVDVNLPPLVTSAPGAYWKADVMPTESTAATATVTVNDTAPAQKWEGMGAAFNELGWKYLTSKDMQDKAIGLLFSAKDGANFAWGRIPIGASDYSESRYTPEDNAGADPAPDGTESNRPGADTSLSKFSLDRDKMKLIPYIKAAQAVKSDLRFWASPWTPPVWMKTGYKKNSGADSSQNAKKPSYYDGGNMKNDSATLAAYAQYFTKFVQGYKEQNINIEIVSPQNEPGYDQNYPSCLWDKATYTTFIGTHLGPAMKTLGVKVMLGTLSNDQKDFDIAAGPVADATAKSFLAVVGAQWNTLDAAKLNGLNSGLPFWATEHKCGNYPWNPSGYPAYNSSQAPNDQAYGVESWGYIKDAIKTVKVTSYNAWNMVLDKSGLGNDTTRDWKQDALLVADGSTVTPTPAYYVFRHISQYAQPGATVVGTTGGDAVAFKNPDGSLVAVMFNSGAANASYVVAIGGKKYQFAMPANGWATLKVKP
ncbi:MAG TPA: glycoside hydrolase family 30 beta sandwich domain-containing protein [Polyangiaceae bacterium]|nr:glycoside hydrolase family 30 beta sandwich domain-containing protein [Polyangiaceae bacterium]